MLYYIVIEDEPSCCWIITPLLIKYLSCAVSFCGIARDVKILLLFRQLSGKRYS